MIFPPGNDTFYLHWVFSDSGCFSNVYEATGTTDAGVEFCQRVWGHQGGKLAEALTAADRDDIATLDNWCKYGNSLLTCSYRVFFPYSCFRP